ncbi:hypothetical protein SANA_23250 [Gottschalkiaceae bacterium SANA]|nr:hypothetical protein SANA_23250 [Gottschalkiaceae bacterium SANA]
MYKIIPSKHVQLSKSIYGISGVILRILSCESLTVEKCWAEYNRSFVKTGRVKYHCSFDYFILAIDFLYMLESIEINSKGVLSIETN